jgi:hypothetical protein
MPKGKKRKTKIEAQEERYEKAKSKYHAEGKKLKKLRGKKPR